jgi:hypothetical protein
LDIKQRWSDHLLINCKTTPPLKEEWSGEAKKEARVTFDNTTKEKYGEYDPALLEVFENEYIAMPSRLDDEWEHRERPNINDLDVQRPGDANINDLVGQRPRDENNNDLDGQRPGDASGNGLDGQRQRTNVQISAQSDMVRGPDLFQNTEIYYPHGDRYEIAKVIGRKRDSKENYIGRSIEIQYWIHVVLQYDFRMVKKRTLLSMFLLNTFAPRLTQKATSIVFSKIKHRHKKNAVDKADGYRQLLNGTRTPRKTVAGWDLEVEWKDRTTAWLP